MQITWQGKKKRKAGGKKEKERIFFRCLVLFFKYKMPFQPIFFSRPRADASGGGRGSGFAKSSLNLINYLAYSAQITKNALLKGKQLQYRRCCFLSILLYYELKISVKSIKSILRAFQCPHRSVLRVFFQRTCLHVHSAAARNSPWVIAHIECDWNRCRRSAPGRTHYSLEPQ